MEVTAAIFIPPLINKYFDFKEEPEEVKASIKTEKEGNDPDVDDDVEDVKMTTMVKSPTKSPTKSPSKKIRSVPFYKKLIYFYDSPATKFVTFTIFYLVFLVIFCYHSILKKKNEWEIDAVEAVLVVTVFSRLIDEIVQVRHNF